MGDIKTYSFGGCDIAKFSPKTENITAKTKVMNIVIGFDEALKLNLALDECIRKINKYKRTTKTGKRAAANLVIHLQKNRIDVAENKL